MVERTSRIREFADLAGVTVRALHHYDRLGLLKPGRTQTGYRVYNAKDLELLEQIVALKFIGLPLNRIKPLLRKNPTDLVAALRAQRTLLEESTDLFEDVESALSEDPAGERVQQLADRWVKLLGAFAPQGVSFDPQLLKNFGAAYPPAGEWPAGARRLDGPLADRRIWNFMAKALAVRG